MFFQQWTGVNAILYYAPTIFKSLGLTGNAVSLLATGVVGIVYVPYCTTINSQLNSSIQHVPCYHPRRYLGR